MLLGLSACGQIETDHGTFSEVHGYSCDRFGVLKYQDQGQQFDREGNPIKCWRIAE